MQLEGTVAIVTGASSGIGEATVYSLAEAGVKVVAAARRTDRLEGVIANVKAKGGEAIAVTCDVTDEAQVKAMIATTIDTYGGLHILVNNAGIMLFNPLKEAEISEWQTMFDVNVIGLMTATHHALPHLMQNETSHIINVSSVAGRRVGAGYMSVYCATKFAVNAFSEGLRKEYAEDNVRVTMIEPGAVLTELQQHIPNQAIKQGIMERIEGDSFRVLHSEDIAASIMYALTAPPHVNINELLIMPTDQV